MIFGAYCLYVFQKYQEQILNSTASLSFWGSVILTLILVSIVANIIITIVFIIIYRVTTNEDEPSFADELDILIELKASRISYYVFIVGFLLAMGALAMDMPLSLTFTILIFSGFFAQVVENVTQLYYYRKGV